jgi:antitoxin ParD1/3/4
MQITVPSPLKPFVEEETAQGGFQSADDYVASLIEAELHRKADEHLESQLVEALESGPPIEVNEEFWRDLKAEIRERHRKAAQPCIG